MFRDGESTVIQNMGRRKFPKRRGWQSSMWDAVGRGDSETVAHMLGTEEVMGKAALGLTGHVIT